MKVWMLAVMISGSAEPIRLFETEAACMKAGEIQIVEAARADRADGKVDDIPNFSCKEIGVEGS